MKLFVIAALITIGSAARLEPLEQEKQLRAYLPPDRQNLALQGNGINGIGGPIPGRPGAVGVGLPGTDSRGSFSNDLKKYLPPGATAASGTPQFAGSLNGFGLNQPNVLNGPEQAGIPSELLNQPDAIPQGTNNLGVNLQPQLNAPSSTQEIPLQAFDEKTGYQY